MIVGSILAILLYFGGGNGPFGDLMTQYVKEPMKTTIVNEDRRDMALKELGSLEDAIKVFNKNVSQDVKELKKLVKNYNSKPEDFNIMFSAALTRNEKEIYNIWDRRNAMLTHIKADEWRTIISSAEAKQAAKNK